VRFNYKYLKCDFEYTPNDVVIQLLSYLTDADENVFVSTTTLDTDTFTAQTYKSSLPLTSSASGLLGNIIYHTYVVGSNFYASTNGGLSVSKNSGSTWATLSQNVRSSFATGNKIFAASDNGIFVSFNAGDSWANKTVSNGLPSNNVHHVQKPGSVLYAATENGLAISTNDGSNWKVILKDTPIRWVSVSGTYIYAATPTGLQVSSNSGISWLNKTTQHGLGSNSIRGIFSDTSSKVYAATDSGVSISQNRGVSWTNYTTGNGLGSNNINGIHYSSGSIYAATTNGLSKSVNGGTSWTNITATNGLGSNLVHNVFLYGSNVYASTDHGLSIFNGTSWTNLIKTPPNYVNFLSIIIGKKIQEKYNASKSGYLNKGGKIVSKIESTEVLVNGMAVQGTGIPKDTYLVGIRDKNSVELSNAVTVTGTNTLTFNTLGWEVDYSELEKLTQVIRFDLL